MKGYKRALETAAIALDPRLVVSGNYREEGGVEATQRLVESDAQFSALLCVNDQTAFGAYLALHNSGLRIPRDVSVVGFDDLYSSRYRIPPLTTVRQSTRMVGQIAAQAMLQLLQHRRPNVTLPEVELVVRDSTAPPTG